LVVLTAAVLIGIYHLPKGAGAPAVSEKATLPEPAVTPAAAVSPAIAVLPFTNMSADPEQEYFSDGLSEELLNQLAQIQDLRVIARTSSFAFKGQNRDVREIATILNVTHLLEGSVRKAGEKLRITAQLINAADGDHLWSKTYDRTLKDIFAIQDEIAREVTGELSLTLGVSFIAPDYGGTKKIEAYEHYLRGVEHIDLRDSRSAADEFKLAIAADPGYGRAWAHLATVLTSRSSDAAGRREHNEAMKRALELVPDLPLTRVAEMQLYVDRREWVRAHDICAVVIAEAHDPTADRSCATFFSGTGRVRTALPYYEAARQTDPLAITEAVGVSRQYALLDKDEQFIHEYTRSQDLSGNRWEIEAYRYIHLMHRGAPAESIIEQLERYCAIRNDTTSPCHGLLRAHRLPGEAETILREQLDALRTTNPLAGTTIAVTAAYFGYRQLALDAIEAFTLSGAGTSPLQYLWFPILSEVRREPRFKEIVRDIGFVDLWRATGDWGDYCRPVGNDDFECE
jgi:TolB-like protein